MKAIREESAKMRMAKESARQIQSGEVPFKVGDLVRLRRLEGQAKVLRFTKRNVVIQFSDRDPEYAYVQRLTKVPWYQVTR